VNFTRTAVALGHFKAIVAGQFVAADMHSITCAMASVDGKPDHFFGIHLLASGARSPVLRIEATWTRLIEMKAPHTQIL
jgi:hypothetical protein